MKFFFLFLSVLNSICLTAQKRLELLETNISSNRFSQYADSYLWTKNWWLVNGIVVETGKGGNARSIDSKLNHAKIDSLGQVFRRYLTPEVMRFGNLNPRISFTSNNRLRPYIRASVYEYDSSSVKLIGQFRIAFGSGAHNSMVDINDIVIVDPKAIVPYSIAQIKGWYTRPPTRHERDITPL